MNFSQRLKELRKFNGLTQTELSEKTGIGKSAIANYETDIRKPSYETLEVFADFFNVDIDYLLGTSPRTELLLTQDEMEMIQTYRSLNGGDKLSFAMYMSFLRDKNNKEEK